MIRKLLRQEILRVFKKSKVYPHSKDEFSFYNDKNLYQIQQIPSRANLASFISTDLYQNIPKRFMEFHRRYNEHLIDNRKDIIDKKRRTLWCGLLCKEKNYNFVEKSVKFCFSKFNLKKGYDENVKIIKLKKNFIFLIDGYTFAFYFNNAPLFIYQLLKEK